MINPVGQRSGFLLSKYTTFPPLGLAYVAAVTPADWAIKIIDENFDQFTFEEADLVAITAFTSNINRAYEIAKVYKERSIKVIMGGIHASMNPHEALHYADSVVIGEVEGIWGKVLDDFENDRMLSTYTGTQVKLKQFKIIPRHDLLHPDYFWHSVQTSRGCPFNCYFCSVSEYLGQEYRQREVSDVLDELKLIPGKYITFVDDNLIGYSQEHYNRAIELFEGMIQLGMHKKWWMQTSINAIDNERVIKLAAQAGCMYAFIGFETIDNEKLKEMRKGVNLKIGVDNYKRVVDTFHKYGIGVLGAFIIGNDYESPAFYEELAEYLLRSGIDIVQLTLLTPLPGTKFMRQLEQEGRLIYQNFPQDWNKYRFSYMVHQPLGLDAETVYIGNNFIKNRIYSPLAFQYRLLKSFLYLKNMTNFFCIYKANRSYKKGWLNSHYHKKYPSSLYK